MTYEPVYDYATGNLNCIRRMTDGAYIPLAEGNVDYQQYLKDVPVANRFPLVDLTKIHVLTADDLPQSTVSAVVKSIAANKLSCIVTRAYKGASYDVQANLTKLTAEKLGKTLGINIGDTVLMTYVDHAPVGSLPIIVDQIAAVVYP